jgi:ferredoxin-NADP reductase
VCAKAVGDFTATLGETRPSDQAYVDMPFGVFTFLRHDAERLIFIAGGIGITPFMSMLRYIHDRKLRKEVILLWSNKQEKDIAFRAELEEMATEMASLKVLHILTRQDDWPGEKGRMNADKLKKHVGDFGKGEFFVCGPPPMMTDVQKTLSILGVPKRRIHMERFALR